MAHQLDPYRLTAVRKYEGAVGIVDLFSPSICAGWYSGVYRNYQHALETARKKYKRSFHTEFGGSSHLSRHTESVITGEGLIETGWEETVFQTTVKNIARNSDWSEKYIVDLFDWHLQIMEKLDWLSGVAQWAFEDFGTPNGSAIIEMANCQAQIEFVRYPDLCLVIEVRNQDFKGDYLKLAPWQQWP